MANVFGRLALLTFLVLAGVTLWYGRVQERLQEKIPTVKEEAAPPPVQKSGELGAANTDYGIILSRNIFKAALDLGGTPAGEQPQVDVEDLAETKMQLVLLGTVSGSKEDARAIIRDEKAKLEDIYHVGSELHGAIITRIGRGKVVLQVKGQEEVLNIKDTESGGPQQVGSPAAEILQPVMPTDGTRTRPAPMVVPQRRISFRNTPQAVPEPEAQSPSTSVPADPGESLPAGEQAKQGDDQPVPVDETTPSGGGKEDGSGQQAQ